MKIAVTQDFALEYQEYIIKQQKDPFDISYKELRGKYRGFISLIILHQALHKAGLKANIELVISPNSKRSIRMVQHGEALLTMRLVIDELSPENTFRSSAVSGSTSHIRGIFGLKSNDALMNVKTLEDLRKLSAVTNAGWISDRATLNDIRPANIELVDSIDGILKLIGYRKIDFVLLGFRNKGDPFNKRFGKLSIVPVPGMLIQLKGTYHFFFSSKHKDSQMVHQALEKGLALMREQGLLNKYFAQGYLQRSDLPEWKVLNSN